MNTNVKESFDYTCIIFSLTVYAGNLLEEAKKYVIHDLEMDKEVKPNDIKLNYKRGNEIKIGEYTLVDLDNDGIKEILLIPYNFHICGNVNCPFYVFKSTENGIKSLLSEAYGIGESAIIAKKIVKNYKEIIPYTHSGATGVYTLHWNGKYYTEAEHGTLENINGKWVYKPDNDTSNSGSEMKSNDISGSSGFKINRFYQSSEDFYHIVISIDRKIRVKCVVYDYSREPVTADTFVIMPPTEDVPIMTKGVSNLIKNVKCFKVE